MNNSEKTKLIEQGTGQPKLLTVNLALAINDQETNIGGTVFGCWDAPGATDLVYIRFNDRSATQIPFKRGKVLRSIFSKLYITVPAGLTGNMEFVYGTGPIEFFDVAPNIGEAAQVLEQIRDELHGDMLPEGYGRVAVGLAAVPVVAANANRKGGVIQSSLGNAPASIIYLGFSNLVSAINNFAELAPGMSWNIDDYPGIVWAISSMAAQAINQGEW